jgi:hypothetical protein
METTDTAQDYQIWSYQRDKNIIAKHKLIADKCSQATAIEGLAQLTMKTLTEGVEHSIEMPDCGCRGYAFYIRQCTEPTYIIYIEFQTGRRMLYDLVYHKKEKDRVLEILTRTVNDLAEHGGPKAIIVVEERDDSEDRKGHTAFPQSEAIDIPTARSELDDLLNEYDELPRSDDEESADDGPGEDDPSSDGEQVDITIDVDLITLLREYLRGGRRDRE